jgi:hypothetical protein
MTAATAPTAIVAITTPIFLLSDVSMACPTELRPERRGVREALRNDLSPAPCRRPAVVGPGSVFQQTVQNEPYRRSPGRCSRCRPEATAVGVAARSPEHTRPPPSPDAAARAD